MLIISADCHAGAPVNGYGFDRELLESVAERVCPPTGELLAAV